MRVALGQLALGLGLSRRSAGLFDVVAGMTSWTATGWMWMWMRRREEEVLVVVVSATAARLGAGTALA